MTVLENIYEISIAVLLLCSLFYVWQLRKTKRERNLTLAEGLMYIITSVSIVLWLGSFIILNYGLAG